MDSVTEKLTLLDDCYNSNAEALHSETGAAAGQNPVLFFKAFDRVAVRTGFDGFASDIAALETAPVTQRQVVDVAEIDDAVRALLR